MLKLKFFEYNKSGQYPMSYPAEKLRCSEISRRHYEQLKEAGSSKVFSGFIVDGKVRFCWTVPERTDSGGGQWRLAYHSVASFAPDFGQLHANISHCVDELIRVANPPAFDSEKQVQEMAQQAKN